MYLKKRLWLRSQSFFDVFYIVDMSSETAMGYMFYVTNYDRMFRDSELKKVWVKDEKDLVKFNSVSFLPFKLAFEIK